MGGVVVVGRKNLHIEVPLFHHHIVREIPPLGVLPELESVVMELDRVLELAEALEEERGGDVLVVDAEGEAVLIEGVEDGFLGEAKDEVLADVAHGAVGGGGVDVEPVRLGRSRNRSEPLVENGEVGGEFGVDGEGFGFEAAHDGFAHAREDGLGLLREAVHWGRI